MKIVKYSAGGRSRHQFRKLIVLIVLVLALLIAATVAVIHYYNENLKPVSNNQTVQLVTIPSGTSVKTISSDLQNRKLIRSATVFEWYVENLDIRSELQAGTYALAPSQSVQQIVAIITQGKTASSLVTILPGKRIDQVRADLINDGFPPSGVYSALVPSQYTSLPIFAFDPNPATLEGLLYPDSFQKNASTNPSVIINESLTEMGQHITPAIQNALASEGLTVYQGITLASIVEQEVSSASDQAEVAQVFISRLHQGMNLQSNVTIGYGQVVDNQTIDESDTSFNSPYNTYIHSGLPPTPISNVNSQVLNAVAYPANTSFLFFVTGSDGVTRFSQTQAQQNSNIQEYGNGNQ